MGGIPIKGLITLIGNLPSLMLGVGGFAGVALLVSKNYLTWIWRTWRYIADGWSSSPLVTWCEKQEDGTCRCPQVLKITKKDGKPQIIVEDQHEGKGCFMNRQCPSGFICKKSGWNPRGKCIKQQIVMMGGKPKNIPQIWKIEGKTTKDGIDIKIGKKKSRKRRR